MRLSPAACRNIFLLSIAIFAIALLIAASMAKSDERLHRSYYMRYQAADEILKTGQFEESYNVYKELSSIYPDAYVLELKMAVCAMNLGMWSEAIEHSRRTMELYPLLVKDSDFMDSLAYSLQKLGENDAASQIEEYYYNFAALHE